MPFYECSRVHFHQCQTCGEPIPIVMRDKRCEGCLHDPIDDEEVCQRCATEVLADQVQHDQRSEQRRD